MITQLRESYLLGITIPLPDAMKAVQRWPQFGPWIAFKVSDMADAVLGIPIEFAGYERLFFDAPLQGAWIAAQGDSHESRLSFANAPTHDRVYQTIGVVKELKFQTRDLMCPHADRQLRTQEFETMLCKWKSHLNGHYTVGKDTHEILEALRGARWGKLSLALAEYLPNV